MRPTFLMDIAGIEAVVARARAVFALVLPDLERRDRRQQAGGQAPRERHRLPELVRLAEESVAKLQAGGNEVDVVTLLELHIATAAFERWRHDPSFDRLVRQCREATHFSHNVVLLTVAGALVDAGLGAEIVPEQTTSTPDLRVRVWAGRLSTPPENCAVIAG